MAWKSSKRQTELKARLAQSSKVYWQTSHELDRMLLKMLHHQGIYTPDDLHNHYDQQMSLQRSDNLNQRPVNLVRKNHKRQDRSVHKIDRTLLDLSSTISQLRNVIDKRYSPR